MNIKYHKPDGVVVQGPYTPAVEVSGDGVATLYVSGQGTYDPDAGEKYLGDNIERQATLALANLGRVLEGSGFSIRDLVKVNIFAIDAGHLSAINKAYMEYFAGIKHLPARTTVIVSALPSGMAIEVEAVAVQSRGRRDGS